MEWLPESNSTGPAKPAGSVQLMVVAVPGIKKLPPAETLVICAKMLMGFVQKPTGPSAPTAWTRSTPFVVK
jgi:hypothetical protein